MLRASGVGKYRPFWRWKNRPPGHFWLFFTSRLRPGADTFRSFAAPPIVPVTITARITSTWRSVIMGGSSGDELAGYYHLQSAHRPARKQSSGDALPPT